MKTKHFVAVIEEAFRQVYSETPFITVPYVANPGDDVKYCLGVLLGRGEHMAVIAAKACHIIALDNDAMFEHGRGGDSEASILDTIEDFCNLMEGMKVAPYMHWHCAYFPGLTEEQMEEEAKEQMEEE